MTRQRSADTDRARLTVPARAEGMRLDVFFCGYVLPAWTRGAVQKMIRSGAVTLSGRRAVKPSTLVRAGQEVVVASEWFLAHRAPVAAPATAIASLRILHEDSSIIVVDKPAGIPVHAGVKTEPSLADALRARYTDLESVGDDPARPGIVHRLDKDTSGVLLVARTPEMYEHLQEQFRRRRVYKEYLALVHGVVSEPSGSIKLPLARSRRNPLRRTVVVPGGRKSLDTADTARGKDAETSFRVLERFREHTLLAVLPKTGRMHQIRVHLAHLGFPVAGDTLYGRKSRHRTPPLLRRQFLHASAVAVQLPSGKTKRFESNLPDDLAAVLRSLRTTQGRPANAPVTYRWRAPRAVHRS